MEVNDEYVEKEVADVNDLQVLSDGVIGSHEALKRLASLERAKILVISDTHRNRDCCLKVIMEARRCLRCSFSSGRWCAGYFILRASGFFGHISAKKIAASYFYRGGQLRPA